MKLTGPPDLQTPPPEVRLDRPEAERPLYLPLRSRPDHLHRHPRWVPKGQIAPVLGDEA